MKKYTKIKHIRVYGAPVYIHWSAIVVTAGLLLLSYRSPLLAIISISSYLGVIALHEAGHAYFANRLGCSVHGVYLGFVHGLCIYDEPYYRKHDYIIAWGGVAAQLIVAIPLISLSQVFEINKLYGLGPVVAFLGYISAAFAVVNLAPSHPLDGAKAWKLIPILIKEHKGASGK